MALDRGEPGGGAGVRAGHRRDAGLCGALLAIAAVARRDLAPLDDPDRDAAGAAAFEAIVGVRSEVV